MATHFASNPAPPDLRPAGRACRRPLLRPNKQRPLSHHDPPRLRICHLATSSYSSSSSSSKQARVHTHIHTNHAVPTSGANMNTPSSTRTHARADRLQTPTPAVSTHTTESHVGVKLAKFVLLQCYNLSPHLQVSFVPSNFLTLIQAGQW